MKVAPNQKLVTIHKASDTDRSGKLYVIIDQTAMKNAIQQMNGKHSSGLVVWMILASNKSGFQFPISSHLFHEEYNISKDCYDAGVKLLIERGFLVRNQGNQYDFFEYPENYKCGEMPHLNVGKPHFQMSENPAFKCGKTPQGNNIIDNIIISSSPSPLQDDDEDFTKIMSAAIEAGFRKNIATKKKLLNLLHEYGKDNVLTGIDICVEHGNNKPAYLRSCLAKMNMKPQKFELGVDEW